MSNYSVTVDNGTDVKEIPVDKAETAVKAAFLAGVAYAGELAITAHSAGMLAVMLEIAGEETALTSLIDTSRREYVLVTEL